MLSSLLPEDVHDTSIIELAYILFVDSFTTSFTALKILSSEGHALTVMVNTIFGPWYPSGLAGTGGDGDCVGDGDGDCDGDCVGDGVGVGGGGVGGGGVGVGGGGVGGGGVGDDAGGVLGEVPDSITRPPSISPWIPPGLPGVPERSAVIVVVSKVEVTPSAE